MIMNNTMIALSMEELEMVNGGWSIFDPVKKAMKTAVKWGYDNLVDPVVEKCKDYVIKPAYDVLTSHPYDALTNIRLTSLESLADLLTGK